MKQCGIDWNAIAALAAVIGVIVSIYFQIVSWSKNKKSLDIDVYVKLIELMRSADHNLAVVREDNFEFNAIEWLNIMESLARLYFCAGLPKVTKCMLKEELSQRVKITEEDKVQSLIVRYKTSGKIFEYIEKFKLFILIEL